MSQTSLGSLKITLGLAILVVIFTKFDRNMLTFVSLFVVLECVYLALNAVITKIKNRKSRS
ncbi:MAG: hypothetical protein ACRC6H_05235 [Culicoidibacterales bacterium]